MKKYYIAPLADMGKYNVGDYHYIDLGSHGTAGKDMAAIVLTDGGREAPSHWDELPHLLDSETTTSHPHLADLKVEKMTGFKLARHLAKIHRGFEP